MRTGQGRRGIALVGVLNVTPDSFSDGGRHFDVRAACARADELVAEGADLLDVGGESTRPGAPPVPAPEQLGRVLEVVRYAARRAPTCVDTTSPEVARACLEAGAVAANDVSLLRSPALAAVVAEARAALVLSHARAPQGTMRAPGDCPEEAYTDVVAEVVAEWRAAAAVAAGHGLPADALVFDPGLGFSKSARHSFELLRHTAALVARAPAPVYVGASRKSFLRLVDAGAAPDARLGASLAAALHARRAGASFVRVHDVRATRQALDLETALRTAPGHADGPASALEEARG